MRLRCYILAQFYPGNFSTGDISDIYDLAATSKEKLISGVLWQIAISIPGSEVIPTLNALASGRQEAIASLRDGPPANVADMHAMVIEHLREVSQHIGTLNNDAYKEFWNEDSRGRPTTPKVEESARDVLLGFLRTRLAPLGLIVEPEGHMVADKRADITIAIPGNKLIVELKRDVHPELWSAPETQLDRFYTRDPEASGYGVYGVFWYGSGRRGTISKSPNGGHSPKTAIELESMLNAILAGNQRTKLRAVVIDVSVPDGQRSGILRNKQRKSKSKGTRKKGAKSRNARRTVPKSRVGKKRARTKAQP